MALRNRNREFAISQDERNDVLNLVHFRPIFACALGTVIQAAAIGEEDQPIGGPDFMDRFARDVAALETNEVEAIQRRSAINRHAVGDHIACDTGEAAYKSILADATELGDGSLRPSIQMVTVPRR